jgi:hypothetical protein
MHKPLLLLITAAFLFFSCKKDKVINSSDARIGLSEDSVYFDTLFTTTGSVTKSVKVSNLNDQKLELSEIALAGGQNSPFAINIDGAPGPTASGLELAAGDSLYIFISVLIKPTAAVQPFILQDSIRISFNGNTRYVKLSAWGQNAHFLTSAIIEGNTVWKNDLPYVIAGSLTVDTSALLTIQSGSRIYFHADAPLLVDGSLRIEGNAGDSQAVYFASDRLDDPYSSYPGGWPGIYLRTGSRDNQFSYAVIKNAYQAVVAEDPSVDAAPKLVMAQCLIDNALDAGIICLHSSIQATNCLISNCTKNISITNGGNYSFLHCTIASYSNLYIQHQQPVLTLTNYLISGTQPAPEDLTATFTNCIIWGDSSSVDDELVTSKQGNSVFDILLDHCILRQKNYPSGIDSMNLRLNADPAFVNIDNQNRLYDFHLKTGSPAIDQGKNAGVSVDLDGNPRPVGPPDIGCYEKQ